MDQQAEERRRPWLVAAGLLFASGVLAALTTYLWWLPCRGAMLVGTTFDPGDVEFGDACLRRMDAGTPFPFPGAIVDAPPGLYALAAAAVVLAGIAWLVPLLVLPLGRAPRLVGAAFGLLLIGVGVIGAWPVGRDEPLAMGALLIGFGVDVAAVYAFCAVVPATWPAFSRVRWQLLLLLVGAAGFSLLRGFADYVVMGMWSQANWDAPPGSGYLIAATLILSALGIAALTLAPSPLRGRYIYRGVEMTRAG